eukprot:scaffold10717_cov61-Phaeocystis_antarctica.AAC.12
MLGGVMRTLLLWCAHSPSMRLGALGTSYHDEPLYLCLEVPRHAVVAAASHHRVPVGHRVTAGVPLERARLDVRRLVNLNRVPHVVVAEVWHTRDDIALVRDTLHAQVILSVHELCERRVTYLRAAEVDDLHLVGELEREAGFRTARSGRRQASGLSRRAWSRDTS